MQNSERKKIHTTYSYYVVPEDLSATPPQPMRVVRSNDSVSAAALLALGCTRNALADTRTESAFKAQARIRKGRLDETERLIQFDTLREMFNHEHGLNAEYLIELQMAIGFKHEALTGRLPAEMIPAQG